MRCQQFSISRNLIGLSLVNAISCAVANCLFHLDDLTKIQDLEQIREMTRLFFEIFEICDLTCLWNLFYVGRKAILGISDMEISYLGNSLNIRIQTADQSFSHYHLKVAIIAYNWITCPTVVFTVTKLAIRLSCTSAPSQETC